MLFNTVKSVIQQVKYTNCSNYTFSIDVKRDDLIDEVVSGNKWRKLKYNVLQAKSSHLNQLITFGGAFSNHLIATAKAAHLTGLESIGIVRGDELNPSSNHMLKLCNSFNMQLHFVSRSEYELRSDKSYQNDWHSLFPNSYLIPEGGANFFGLIGCQEIWSELDEQYDYVVLAAGTGTTAAGVLSGMPEQTKMIVFSALKGDFIKQEILSKISYGFHNDAFTESCSERLTVMGDEEFGGYGKFDQRLVDFIAWCESTLQLPLDKIYTAKAFYGLLQHLDKGLIKKNSKILFIHTGGLIGNLS
jgi:1-aminocyclopropane-1-carboxylate deaminase